MKGASSISVIAVTALALCACTKELPVSESGEKVSVTVSLSGGASKATVPDSVNEAKVNGFQVFVFNGDNLDSYGKASVSEVTALEKTLSATTGERTVVVLVNAPDCGGITSLTELEATASSLCSDNAGDNFVMAGKILADLKADSSVSVEVNRLAARVRIDKISRKMGNPSLAGLESDDFHITRIYLGDAVDNYNFGFAAPASTIWKNSVLNSPATISSDIGLLCFKPAAAIAVAQNGSWDGGCCLYCYPNATEADGNAARVTRLVVECLIDGEYCTYVIPTGPVKANRSYEIKELVITKLGNPSDGDDIIEGGEDDILENSEVSFKVSVSDWEQVLLGDNGTVTI